MHRLLLALAAAAWLQDGALRRWVDPRIATRPIAGTAAWCLAGVALAVAALLPATRRTVADAVLACSLALVALCLAAEAAPRGADPFASLRRWRAVAPIAGGSLVALLLAAGTTAAWPAAALAIGAGAGALALLAGLHPALDGRLRAAGLADAWRRGPALVLLAAAVALGTLGLGLRLP